MKAYHLAQVNIARMRTTLEDPAMSGFVARLEDVNALADRSPGFVWRFQTGEGNATYLRPYPDERILFNMSVWQSVEALQDFVFRSDHKSVLRRRHEWFEKLEGPPTALWWVPAGHLPTVAEAKARLAYLEVHGPTACAFTFKALFAPEAEAAEPWAVDGLRPCPA